MPDGEELTVWDKDYDMETYFYGKREIYDNWGRLAYELSKLLTIVKIESNGVTVNLSDLIQSHIDILKKNDLFISCDIDSIMEDIENIIAGSVSENWFGKFVHSLRRFY